MNPKGKIPLFRHNEIFISESVAAMNYVANNFEKPLDFFIPTTPKEKAKVDEWSYFCAMELDALSIYILRRHEQVENRGLSNLYGEAPNAIKTIEKPNVKNNNGSKNNIPITLPKNLCPHSHQKITLNSCIVME